MVGIISSPNTSRNCLWWCQFLIKTQDYSLELLTSLMKGNLKQLNWKLWKISRKTYVVISLLIKLQDYSLGPTIGLKPPLQILAWKCSEKKRCSKISKTRKEYLQNLFLFLWSYSKCASQNSQFNKNRLQEKYFLLVFWSSWKFAWTRAILRSFY